MRIATIINSNDVSGRVLKDKGMKIAVNIEDEGGQQKISAATVGLSNMHGEVDFLLNQTERASVVVNADSKPVYYGFTSPVDNTYDKHQREMSLKFISREADVIQRLKGSAFPFPPGSTQFVVKNIYNYPPTLGAVVVTPRYFVSVNNVLANIAEFTDLSYISQSFLDNIFVGGSYQYPNGLPIGTALDPVMPDWSYYDFVNNIAKTFNCLWRITTGNLLELRPKVSIIETQTTPFTLTSRKNTVQIEPSTVGSDVVAFAWEGYPFSNISNQFASGRSAWTVSRSGSITGTREVESAFRLAGFERSPFGRTVGESLPSWIAVTDSQPNYLIHSIGSAEGQSRLLKARDIAERYWRIELRGTDRVSGDYNLLHATVADIETLANAFYTRFLDDHTYISAAEIDWQGRTAKITGVRYVPGT